MRRLAALIIGVATAQPDIDAVCRRPTYPDRYVVTEILAGYTTKEGDEYDCDHVAKKTKRCTTRFSEGGVRADDACKKTCGTC